VDILWFLRRRLSFAISLYDDASAPFLEKMRKIEAGEEPFADTRDPFYQDVSEPAFLEEFLEANNAVEVLGHWCLLMIHASLQAYLREYVVLAYRVTRDSSEVSKMLNGTGGRNWFDKYRLLFLTAFGIDWQKGPTKLTDIEQINLTRDDLIHNVDVATTLAYRTRGHANRFPDSLFTDDIWEQMGIGSKIKLGRDQLRKAQQIVDEFCNWLDQQRPY
jgi:hypothetical protein